MQSPAETHTEKMGGKAHKVGGGAMRFYNETYIHIATKG